MSIFLRLSTLAVRQLVGGACATVGLKQEAQAVVGFLTERFTDQSQRLITALQSANENAWKALEIALAGDSFWERCKATIARSEDKAFAQQVRAFLNTTTLPELTGKDPFRQECLEELRAARKSRTLTAAALEPRQLAEQTSGFARFTDPKSLFEAEWQVVLGMADELKDAGFASLSWLISQRPHEGTPILVAGVRYYFRRAVEEDQQLFQGLAFAKLEALNEAQEKGFNALTAILVNQAERLEELLGEVKAVVVQTHNAVLDLQSQMSGQTEQMQQIGQAVQKLLEQHQLAKREIRHGDSLSIRNDGERQLVKQLVSRYRAVPEEERRKLPALLNAIGKLEVVAGDFEAAQKDFQQVAILAQDNSAQAEAHFNAYRAALERGDSESAMKEFIEALKLDAKRFAPFPVGKYHPKRILGAGGFGVAFLCRHKYMNADVVVKSLQLEALGRETDTVFAEAQALRQLDHPSIIRISECGYVDANTKRGPHIIMDYFQGQTLEEYVKEKGPLAVEDLLAVARQVADGLQAAHGAKILHRDVKPANLLVRKEGTTWKVKIIDFGLAMTQKVVQTSQKAGTSKQRNTMIGSSIAGTLDYGSPEQMGRRTEPVGPYSDAYGWAKTCCYALFQTTQPLMKHWQSIPTPLAQLLEDCLAENPSERPATFAKVLERLTQPDAIGASASNQNQVADFNEMTDSVPSAGERESPARKKRKVAKSNNLPLLIGGGVIAIGSIVLAVILSSGKKKDSPETDKEIGQAPATVKEKSDPAPKNNTGSSSNSKTTTGKGNTTPKDTSVKKTPESTEPKQEPKTDDEPVGEVRQFNGHTGGIWSVDLSSDGRLAIAGTGKEWKNGKFTDVPDNTVRVWEVATGKPLHRFDKHSDFIKQVAFSPDNRKAVSCSADKTVRLWDVEEGRELHCFKGHTDSVTGVAFIPQSSKLASVGADGTLRVWDTSSGNALHEFPLGIGEIHCFEPSLEGSKVFCGTKTGSAHLVDLATGNVERNYDGQTNLLHSIAVSPDGQVLVAGSANGNAMMWSVSDAKKLGAFEGHVVRFTKDSRRILLGCNDFTVRLLDRSDLTEIIRFRGHKAYVQGVAFSPGGDYALSGSWDGTLRLWKLPMQTPNLPGRNGVDATADAMKALQGEWLCVAMEEIGKKFDEKTIKEQDRRVTIKGSSYTMKRTKDGVYAVHDGKFEINATNGHFDFTGTNEVWVGIYELKGDTLKVCYRYKRNSDLVRPTKFETDENKPNISVFYTFNRVDSGTAQVNPGDSKNEMPKKEPEPGFDAAALLKLKPGSLQGRSGPMRKLLLKQGGGNEKTEAAVALGLKWLATQQKSDGRWVLEGRNNDFAGTALGLLPFLGAGHTHKQGTYTKTIGKGIDFLLSKQGANGHFNENYEHAIATLALCEAYAMTGEQRLKLPAQRAIDYIVAAQHEGGSWHYFPKQPGDTSVTGWNFMALKTAEMGGLKVPKESIKLVGGFLDSVAATDGGYGYRDRKSIISCSAIGLLCREYLGWTPKRAEMVKGIGLLNQHSPPTGDNRYYYYYATQAIRHFGGDNWTSWNPKVQELLLGSQLAGKDAGSWPPNNDEWCGKLLTTSLSLMTLEVYYRHVPLFLSEQVKSDLPASK